MFEYFFEIYIKKREEGGKKRNLKLFTLIKLHIVAFVASKDLDYISRNKVNL